jgi:hypothetical protein
MLAGPFAREVGETSHSHTMGLPTLDGCSDEMLLATEVQSILQRPAAILKIVEGPVGVQARSRWVSHTVTKWIERVDMFFCPCDPVTRSTAGDSALAFVGFAPFDQAASLARAEVEWI